MIAGPGSTLWLMGHDLRLTARDMRATGAGRRVAFVAILGSVVALLHVMGFLAAPTLAGLNTGCGGRLFGGVPVRPACGDALLTFTVILAGAFTLFVSKAITEATDSLHQRADLDLLLSSPIPPSRVLMTRLFAIAVIAGFLPLIVILPLVDGMVLRGWFAWTGFYPVLVALALTAASLGAALTFGLLAWVGPRWTRVVARTLATLFGAAAFLFTQARLMVPEGLRRHVWMALVPGPGDAGWGVAWWPARAALGAPLPIAGLLVFAAGVVLGTSALLGHAHGSGVIGAGATAGRGAEGKLVRRFQGALGLTLMRKEFLLLRRHPGVTAQTFYQFVFLLPGVMALSKLGSGAHAGAIGVVFLTTLMAGRITKVLAVPPFEADQAAELAAGAPVGATYVLRAKLAVATGALLVVAGLPLAGIAWRLPFACVPACIGTLGACATRLALAATGKQKKARRGLKGRLGISNDGLLGALIDVGWGLLAVAVLLLL
jgi:ABC-2 type transport system permease protein